MSNDDPLQYHPAETSPENLVASIARELGYTCAGWQNMIGRATTRQADLSYYTSDMALLLSRRWGQPPGTSIKSDFWLGTEGPYSRVTLLQLRALARKKLPGGWQIRVMDELLSTPEGWRRIGSVGYFDVGRLVHRRSCNMTDVALSRIDTFAAQVQKQRLDRPPLPHQIIVTCQDGKPTASLDPSIDGRVRWSTASTSWVGTWTTELTSQALADLPTSLQASGERSEILGVTELRQDPCPDDPPDDPKDPPKDPPDDPPQDDPTDDPPSKDDPDEPLPLTSAEERAKELLDMGIDLLDLIAVRAVELYRMVKDLHRMIKDLWRHHTPEGRDS